MIDFLLLLFASFAVWFAFIASALMAAGRELPPGGSVGLLGLSIVLGLVTAGLLTIYLGVA